MKKKIYVIDVVSKLSGRHAVYFYAKANCLADAAVYAMNYLVPDLLEIKSIYTIDEADDEIIHEVYDTDEDRL